MITAQQRWFPRGRSFLTLIEEISPIALRYEYAFITDEAWRELSNKLSVSRRNQIIVRDNLDKSHLAALTALIRTKRWADAVCLMGDAENFLGFASAMRGLLENAGDIGDGLRNVLKTIAVNRDLIASALDGSHDHEHINWSD
jgi:hypothetical protein